MEAYDTIIGQNVRLHGNLANQGAIQINGTIEGQVESDSTIIVGPSAVVKGPMRAKTIEVSGEVHGTVVAEERLELNPKSKLYGDVATKNFVIKLGALFVGKSSVLDDSKKSQSEQAS